MFEFATLWVFLALPLPWLVYRFLPSAPETRQAALKIPFFQEIATLAQTTQRGFQLPSFKKWGAYLIWILMVVAAAGPEWLGEPIALPRQGRDLLLAVDISGSMRTPDMIVNNHYVTRIKALKYVADEFIESREGDKLGLIVFGSRAYLQTPLTFDRNTVKKMLNDTSVGLAGSQTAIGDAIGLAIKRLMDKPTGDRILILLTDGANNSGSVAPAEAAKLASEYGIKIYTIGFGAEEILVSDFFGAQQHNPSADLDEKTLKEIARITGGSYFRAKDTESLRQIYSELNRLEPVSQEEEWFRPITPLYYWPLGLALLLSVLLSLHTLWQRLPRRQRLMEEKV